MRSVNVIALYSKLERRYDQLHLHFITCSCHRRLPFLQSAGQRDQLLKILSNVREKYQFSLVGYVIIPEHIHILISEPRIGTPGTVMQVLKQQMARAMGTKTGPRDTGRPVLSKTSEDESANHFWQRRFYDFNVWTAKKRIEKLHYMHMNPVKRGLVNDPKLWLWSSYGFYQYGETNICTPDRQPRYGLEGGNAKAVSQNPHPSKNEACGTRPKR